MDPLAFWISVLAPSIFLLVSYAVLACRWQANGSVALGQWGPRWKSWSFRACWTLGTLVTAAAYLVLLTAAATKPNIKDVLVFAIFPIVAWFWSWGVIGNPGDSRRYRTQKANWAVVETAGASMFLLLAVDGRRSSVPAELQWACAAWVVAHHLVIDGIWWPASTSRRSDAGDKWRKLHSIAACIHYVAVFTLFAWGTIEADYDGTRYLFPVNYDFKAEPPVWEYTCKQSGTTTTAEDVAPDPIATTATPKTIECADDDKLFSLAGRTRRYPLLHIAAFYALWSGTVHLAAAVELWDLPRRLYKWIDYLVSAPLMLSVVSVTFGNFSLPGVLFGPLLLFKALCIAAIVEAGGAPLLEETDASGNSSFWAAASARAWRQCLLTARWLRRHSNLALAWAWLLFAASWVPTAVTIGRAREYDERPLTEAAPGTGKMPVTVVYFFVLIVLLFASFGVVYMYYQYRAPTREHTYKEKAYLALSMVTKLTLHTFLLLTVVALGQTLDGNTAGEMQRLAYGYGFAAVFIIVAGLIVKFTGPVYGDDARRTDNNGRELDDMAYAMHAAGSE